MSTRDWIWLGAVVLLLLWNFRLLRKLGISQERGWQHFLTWHLAAFGVLSEKDWEEKKALDEKYGVNSYKDAYDHIVRSAAGNPFNHLDLDWAKARIESEWRRW